MCSLAANHPQEEILAGYPSTHPHHLSQVHLQVVMPWPNGLIHALTV